MIREVAETGDEGAMYNLASAYKNGDGVPQDDDEALKWRYAQL
jgi:TPR repeat protein